MSISNSELKIALTEILTTEKAGNSSNLESSGELIDYLIDHNYVKYSNITSDREPEYLIRGLSSKGRLALQRMNSKFSILNDYKNNVLKILYWTAGIAAALMTIIHFIKMLKY